MANDEYGDLFDDTEFATPGDREGAFDAQLSLPLPFVAAPTPVQKIVKRDGREEGFDKHKIGDAIFKAAQSIGGQDRDLAESLASAVAIYLSKRLMGKVPGVDHVHDAVERVLVHMSHAKTALAYARYRDRRARIRRLREGDLRALLGELEEARTEREALGGHGDRALFVRTSADTLMTWDREKIVEALVRETGLETPIATLVAVEVEQQIERAGIQALTTSLVRELVGAKLIEHGLEEHRERHRRLGVPLYDSARIVRGATPETVATDPVATDRVLAGAMKKEYALAEVFSPAVTEAHLRGELHLHHLALADRLLCADLSLATVIRHGLGLPGRRPFSKPPKHADTLLAQMVKYTAQLQGFFAEAVTWDAINIYFAPFLQGMKPDMMSQFAKVLVYEYAYRALAHGAPSPAARLGIHWRAPAWLRDREAMGPDGAAAGKTYAAFEPTAQQFAWAIIDIFRLGGIEGITFEAPVPWVHLGPEFFSCPGHDRFLRHAAQVAAFRKNVHFVLGRDDHTHDDVSARAMGQPRQVALHRVTLNLPRAAYVTGKEATLFEEIDRLIALAATAHDEKRDFLDSLLDPAGNGPLGVLAAERDEQPGMRAEETVGLVAVDGLNECVQTLLNAEPHANPEAAALAERILAHVAARCEAEGARRDLRLAAAQNEDAVVSRRFATLDAQMFPKTAATVVKTDAASQAMEYTSGARLARAHGLSPIEGARLEGRLHAHLTANPITTVTLPDGELAAEAIADFLKKAYRQTENRCLVFR